MPDPNSPPLVNPYDPEAPPLFGGAVTHDSMVNHYKREDTIYGKVEKVLEEVRQLRLEIAQKPSIILTGAEVIREYEKCLLSQK